MVPTRTKHEAAPSGAAPALFAVLALVFGGMQALLQPPQQVTDEGGHFARSVRLANGGWLPGPEDAFALTTPEMLAYTVYFYDRALEVRQHALDGDEPVGVFQLSEYYDTPTATPENARRPSQLMTGTARLNPSHGYLGQAAFLSAAGQLSEAPAVQFFAGRLGALAVSVLITTIAIALLPVGRWVALFVAMTPMVVIIRSSYSSDSMTVAISFLAVALLLRARVRTGRIALGELAGCLGAFVALALLKANLVVFPVAALLLPSDRFASARHRWSVLALLAVLPLASAAAWWSWLASTESPVVVTPAPVATEGITTIPPLLPPFLLESPGLVAEHGWKWLRQLVGDYRDSPGYRSLTINLPAWAVLLWTGLLGLLAVGVRPNPRIGVVCAGVAALTAAGLLLGTMFLFWLGPHIGGPIDHHIAFLNGRYLHPALGLTVPFAVGLPSRPPPRILERAQPWIAVLGAVAVMSASLLANLRANLGWP